MVLDNRQARRTEKGDGRATGRLRGPSRRLLNLPVSGRLGYRGKGWARYTRWPDKTLGAQTQTPGKLHWGREELAGGEINP